MKASLNSCIQYTDAQDGNASAPVDKNLTPPPKASAIISPTMRPRVRASRAAGNPVALPVTDRCRRHQATAFLGLSETPPRPAEWPGGSHPPALTDSGRDSLPSSGSCHPACSTVRTHDQWAKSAGECRLTPRSHFSARRRLVRSRLYFCRAQRMRYSSICLRDRNNLDG